MKHVFVLALLATAPAWGQSIDSTAYPTIPPKSNFRSGFMLEPGFAYTWTHLPGMKAFFRQNQVKFDKNIDQVVTAGFGYRVHRFKFMIHSFFGIDQRLLPPDLKNRPSIVARRTNLSGVDFTLGYDVANTRNKRVFVNASVGSIRYEYNLFRPTGQTVPFQTILQYNPPTSVPSLYFNSGYWDVNVELSQREKRPDSYQWVSRLGYRRSLGVRAWQSDAYQLTDAPTDRIGQFYFQVGMYISRNKAARPTP